MFYVEIISIWEQYVHLIKQQELTLTNVREVCVADQFSARDLVVL